MTSANPVSSTRSDTAVTGNDAVAWGELDPHDNTKHARVRFALGFLIYSIFDGLAVNMVGSVLMPQQLKEINIANPNAALGSINAAGAILSVFYAVIIGALSDRTRTRFGRRTPWIAGGAVVFGISYWMIGVPRSVLTIGIAYCLALFGLNAVKAPMLSMISDRIDPEFRGTASAAAGGGLVVGQAAGTFVGSFFISKLAIGFILAMLFAFCAGFITLLILPNERTSRIMPKDNASAWQVIVHAFTPPTKGASDFWKAFICRTCLILGYQMITSYQLYILEDHIHQSKSEAAAAISVMSMITMIVSFAASFLSGPISDKLKARKPPILFACALYAIGIAMPWIFPSVTGMYLFAGIAGFGYGMYSAVDQALNVDVLPNKRDAGKDLGILNIATCAGQALGSTVTSSLVSVTGNYSLVFPVAICIVVCAAISAMSIKRIK